MQRLPVVALLVFAAAPLTAQSSQFGVRGLGIPLRPLSVRATGTGGAFGLFDPESAFNPASVAQALFVTASFATVQDWRSTESPSGSAAIRDNRFPGFFVSGPISGTRLAIALSASGYTDRNYELASRDSILVRGAQLGTFDTLISHGGISDLRAAIGWRQSKSVQWGLAFHMLTGSNRIDSRRGFADTTYIEAAEKFTFSYLGYGVSAGVIARIGHFLTLGGMVRTDHGLAVERDSIPFGNTRLPITVSGGARLQLGARLLAAGSVVYRNWSISSADLVAMGGIGSSNTTEWNGGFEYLTKPHHPQHLPLRFGVYHSSLPFPLRIGDATSETGLSAGTGIRFVNDKAGVDLALQRIWRKGGASFTEQATELTFGVSIRP